MTNPPQWAKDLLEVVVRENGVPPISLTWAARRNRKYSSGFALVISRRVHVISGSCQFDAKMILLHEIAHCLRPASETHSPQFWSACFSLYKRHGISMDYAVRREGQTYASSIPAARLAGFGVSEELADELRKTRRSLRAAKHKP